MIAVLLALACLVLAGAAQRAGLLRGIERMQYDAFHRLAGDRGVAGHTVLVAVDEAVLALYPTQPLVFWAPLFARAVRSLREAGATVIGLDFLLRVSAETWLRESGGTAAMLRDHDLPLRQQLAAGGVVVTASASEDGSLLILPEASYLLSLPAMDLRGHVGLAEFPADSDGAIRRFSTGVVTDPGTPAWGFATLLALKAATASAGEATVRIGSLEFRPGEQHEIAFAGPPGSIPSISMADVLEGDGWQSRVRGKVVVIGATYPGSGDRHDTPYNRALFGFGGQRMSGAELHANVVDALLRGTYLQPAAQPVVYPLYGIVLLLCLLGFRYLSPWRGLLLLLGVACLAATASYLLFLHDTLLPAAPVQAAVCAGYISSYGLRLTREERTRARMRRLFERYVSAAVVRELLEMNPPPTLGGREYLITVLFVDIRGFTTLTERLAAHETVELLNRWFECACAHLLAAGGSIDKFVGDAVMAQFGAPVPHRDHARRALQAAIAIRESLPAFRMQTATLFASRGLPPFDVGIGIHTGPAIVGTVGSTVRSDFTAIGDTVNLASRLESTTKTLGWGIVVSDATAAAAGSGIMLGGCETIHVKGRVECVTVHELLGVES